MSHIEELRETRHLFHLLKGLIYLYVCLLFCTVIYTNELFCEFLMTLYNYFNV